MVYYELCNFNNIVVGYAMKDSILIRVMGNIGDAICAEPAISQHIAMYPNIDHYVQCRCPELYYDMPGIVQSYHIEDQISRKCCTKFVKASPDFTNHIVDYLSRQLGIVLDRRRPRFDHINEDLKDVRTPFRLDKHVVAISVNASNPIRDWSRDKWEMSARQIRSLGYRTLQLDNNVEPLESVDCNLVNTTTIRQVLTILRKVKMLVTIDSGLSHLAAAAGVPCVCLFGPVAPAIRAHDLTYAVTAGSCMDCWPTYRGNKSCPQGHHKCIADITVDQVMREVLRACD